MYHGFLEVNSILKSGIWTLPRHGQSDLTNLSRQPALASFEDSRGKEQESNSLLHGLVPHLILPVVAAYLPAYLVGTKVIT